MLAPVAGTNSFAMVAKKAPGRGNGAGVGRAVGWSKAANQGLNVRPLLEAWPGDSFQSRESASGSSCCLCLALVWRQKAATAGGRRQTFDLHSIPT